MKLLISFPRYYWNAKMSCARRHIINELASRNEVEVKVKLTGPGWPCWMDGAPLAENISRLMPDADAIYWYKPHGSREVAGLVRPAERGEVLAVEAFNEAYWPNMKALRETQVSRTDLVVCHHQHDLLRFSAGASGWQPKVVHIPHGASQLFADYACRWEDRTVDVLLTGVLSMNTYPLRTRVARLIESGVVKGQNHILPHPGYRLTSHAEVKRQEVNYASWLGRAKIVVACGSIYGYGLSKYAESAAAGAAIAGEIPIDYRETLGPHIIPMTVADSDAELVEKLNLAMAMTKREWLERAESLFTAWSRNHSMEYYVDRLLAEIRQAINDRKASSLSLNL